jgi:polyhydroxybutyrate depolymerase
MRSALLLVLTLACAACGSSGGSGAGAGDSGGALDSTGGGGSDSTGGGMDTGPTDGRSPSDSSDTGDAGGGGDSGPPAEAGPCATRTGHRGLTSRSMTVGGLNRTYLVYLPQTLDPSTAVPFVFVHHGLTMSGQVMYQITQYTDLADAQGIGVAFPDGQSGPNSLAAPWNVGSNVCPATAGVQQVSATGDDFAFIEAMKLDVAQDQCLDQAHVFVTGFSMGGYFSHNAGCMMSDIRAVAPHSGGAHDLSACTNAREPCPMAATTPPPPSRSGGRSRPRRTPGRSTTGAPRPPRRRPSRAASARTSTAAPRGGRWPTAS